MSDLDRLRAEYSRRQDDPRNHQRYSKESPEYRFQMEQRRQALIDLLQQHGFSSNSRTRLLEVGCGSGGVLLEFQSLGISPGNLLGIDLLYNRLREAHQHLPQSLVCNADGQHLPYTNATFDVVVQFTAFSSVLDATVKNRMATEMLRVLTPGGIIIWYDFWWNPTNRQTRGIKPAEISALFPDCSITLKKTTLAPPISRLLVPLSIGLARTVESGKLLNSHYLALIHKNTGGS